MQLQKILFVCVLILLKTSEEVVDVHGQDFSIHHIHKKLRNQAYSSCNYFRKLSLLLWLRLSHPHSASETWDKIIRKQKQLTHNPAQYFVSFPMFSFFAFPELPLWRHRYLDTLVKQNRAFFCTFKGDAG